MKRYLFTAAFILIKVYSTYSQTVCAQMMDENVNLNNKVLAYISQKTGFVQPDDYKYMVGLSKESARNLDRLLGNSTDADLLHVYHFCRLYTHGSVGRYCAKGGYDAQTVYDLLQPDKEMALALNDKLMKDFRYIICDHSATDYKLISTSDYEKYAVDFFYAYIDACVRLGKNDEADEVFESYKKYNYGMVANGEYDVAATMVLSRSNMKVFDKKTFDYAQFCFKIYSDSYGYDSTALTIYQLGSVLDRDEMVDSTIDGRARAYYDIYTAMRDQKGALISPYSEEMIRNMFINAMACISEHNEIPRLLDGMRYADDSEITKIIELHEPVTLGRVIAMGERMISRYKGKLKEPFFWQNMGRLYAAAGMNDAAANAEKMYDKYK